MFRLTAEYTDDHFDFVLHRDDAKVLVTGDPIDLALRMLYFGIDDPLRLIDAARQWGAVEIRDQPVWHRESPL